MPRTLAERLINPAPEVRRLEEPSAALERLFFLWTRGAHAGQLASALRPDMEAAAAPADLLKLAALRLEAQQWTAATAMAEAAYAAAPELLHSTRYLALTGLLGQTAPDLVAQVPGLAADLQAWEHIQTHRARFEALIAAHAGSIALVGNGPALMAAPQGAEIDAHDLVIRFNVFRTGPKVRAHTGGRTDIWVGPGPLADQMPSVQSRFAHVVIYGQSAAHRRLNEQDRVLPHSLSGQSCGFIPWSVFHELRQIYRLDIASSSGLGIAMWIAMILGDLRGVDLYGFGLTDQPNRDTVNYFERGFKLPAPPHNWPEERRVLDALLAADARAPDPPGQEGRG